ncbi:WD40 repeat-like protein [Gymnopus androsaceus JB14]|uniref:WD40 repeat-like protein n=1 Tax=Gymnopus androsaceus JB14 TaxID=1447944 RepID=A0A6A4GIM9_9AGAR|nr:WD40 repeat-like protein [Gymnopus androsaceus JB14]
MFEGSHDFSIHGGHFNNIQGNQINYNSTSQVQDLLNKLNPVQDASYKSEHHSTCLSGTRVAILNSLMEWAADDKSPKIYWLYGIAGTGKSTIAQSFCVQLQEKGFSVASFCCSRNAVERSDIRKLVPTIVDSIARADNMFCQSTLHALEKEPSVAKYSVSEQIKLLLVNQTISCQNKWIIVIDGLDECSDPHATKELIETLIDNVHILPAHIFVASREEKSISHRLNTTHETAKVALHEVDGFIVQADIYNYLKFHLSNIDGLVPPIEGYVKYLMEQSSKLFIYASTAVKYVGDGYNPLERMQMLMNQKKLTGIYALYSQILEHVMSKLDDTEIKAQVHVLHAVMCLQDPLSMKALELLFIPKSNISLMVSAFHSVLEIPANKNSDSPVQAFHASFPEFLENLNECPERYQLNVDQKHQSHAYLALCSLKYLNCQLQRNPLGLELDSEISELNREQVNRYFSKKLGLEYACKFWSTHWNLGAKKIQMEHITELSEFVNNNVLKWIEHCILLGIHDQMSAMFEQILPYLKIQDNLWDICSELPLFISQNVEIIMKWPLEIYNSALIWTPNSSLLMTTLCFQDRKRMGPTVVRGLKGWSQCEQVVPTAGAIYYLAFLGNSTKLLFGSSIYLPTESDETGPLENDVQLNIFNTTTGQIEHTARHTVKVDINNVNHHIAASQDGSLVFYGTNNGEINIWNTSSGKIEHVLVGHANDINAVSLSPDNSRVVSGSKDTTLRIWNTYTGIIEYLLVGHTDEINDVVFSPDGSTVISGSNDNTLRIWNTFTGKIVHVLKGHTNHVVAVAFFPDGTKVLSGSSDNTLRIWTTLTGKTEFVFKGHTDRVNSVAVFPAGHRVASGSHDGTVRIWNTSTGKTEHVLKYYPSSSVRLPYLAIFPDGSRVVFKSSYEVKIWNTSTAKCEHSLMGHDEYVTAVAVSPCGSRVASGSLDTTITIWNTYTKKSLSKEVLKHPRKAGHPVKLAISLDSSIVAWVSFPNLKKIWITSTARSDRVLTAKANVDAIAVSPDGSRVISGLDNGTVQILNTATGKTEQVLKGHTSNVKAVAVSSDGCRMVSGSLDGTLRIWNLTTGKIELVLRGHYEGVQVVAFSSDGSRVASASNKEVRVWNTSSGTTEHILQMQQSDYFMSAVAVSPNGSTVACGFWDGTVQIWNTSTGETNKILRDDYNVSWQYTPLELLVGNSSTFYALGKNENEIVTICNRNSEYQIKHVLWLPSHVRDPACAAYAGSLIALCGWGIPIINMSSPPDISDTVHKSTSKPGLTTFKNTIVDSLKKRFN